MPRRCQLLSPDVNLVLKLQQKLKEVEGDRDRLERRLERLEQGTPDSENKQAHDQIRVRGDERRPARGAGVRVLPVGGGRWGQVL